MYPFSLPTASAILQETGGEVGSPAPGTDPSGTEQTAPSPCGYQTMLPMLAILAIFWIVMIGPERKRKKAHQAMLQALKKGDRVMTSSGIYGSVVAVQEDVVTVQVSENVRIKFARAAMQTVIDGANGKPSGDGDGKS